MNRSSRQESAKIEVDSNNPTFLERWVSGTYLVSGIFPIEKDLLTVEQITAQIPSLYSSTKSNKQTKWPRGICGYYLIPIYIAEAFNQNVIDWVHSSHPYRWAIWHEPILYCNGDNSAHLRKDYGIYGQSFRPYLFNIIKNALFAVAGRFNHRFPEKLNGQIVESCGLPVD
jgi:hypothetical protein